MTLSQLRLGPRLNIWLDTVQGWLWPPVCLLCGARADEDGLCRGCRNGLPLLGNACTRCARPLAVASALCGACQRRPPAFDRTLACFQYRPPVDHLIQTLKYRSGLHMIRPLARMLIAQARQRPHPDVIVPVPLHPSRLRERGFNQSLELARPVARQLQIPLDYRNFTRTRPTASQTGLPMDERARNVRKAFAATRAFAGKQVALIDDVMTTGHTVNAAAECLRKAGASAVEVWVVARA